jgi:glycine/D-amino acid oxidase-like deaminating enzyme
MPKSIVEPQRETPVFREYDVVVLGGGPAGITAAVAASRDGASTLLVERYGFLGGMGTAAGVTNFCGLHANVRGDFHRVVRGLSRELTDRVDHLGGLNWPPHVVLGKVMAQAYDTAAFKCAADDLIAAHRCAVLYHALAVGCALDGDRIAALLVETKSGRFAVPARIFIDCSGDGDLASWAGAPTQKGDEGGNLLYPTSMFRVGGVDHVRAGDAYRIIPQIMEQAERDGAFKFPRKAALVRPQKNPFEWRVNVTQIRDNDDRAIDGTDANALSFGEIEGRKQIRNFLAFLKARVPGFEDAYLLDIPPQIGIRETRRVMGDYCLTEDDVLDCVDFDDTIGVNAWPLEIHVPGDVELRFPPADSRGFNHLPLRMLCSRGVENLLSAGRCGSMTHLAQAAARVSGGCFVMGEAAGTLASLALGETDSVRGVQASKVQARLEKAGVFLGRPAEALPEGIA